LTACLVTDGWATRNGRSYIGTFAATLDDEFRVRIICLDMTECQKKHHTAAEITGLLAKTVEDFDNLPAAVYGARRWVHRKEMCVIVTILGVSFIQF